MNIKSFLLAGQSNMAGRGTIGEVPPIHNAKCHMLRNGLWQPMSEPINPDRAIFEGTFRSGVGLSASFADEFAKDRGEDVGLIPCADGGTMISQWMPGETLFDNAVMQTRMAMRTSEFAGILWHQGEQDCRPERIACYKERLITVLNGFRKALNAEKLPIIMGELTLIFPPDVTPDDHPAQINRIIHEVADELPYCAVASSEGLTLKEDWIHFSSASYREFGKRYYAAYRSVVGQ